MSRSEANTRLDNQLSRKNCQMFSTGFNSGARAGSSTSVRLSGTTRSLARCHPARSISMTPWAPGATACATSARCRLMACVSHRGRTRAAPLPCCGQIAPKIIMGGKAIVERQKPAQEVQVLTPPEPDFDEVLRARQRCAEHEEHDLRERVDDLPDLARVLEGREVFDQGPLCRFARHGQPRSSQGGS